LQPKNVDTATVEGFGDEWATYDQAELSEDERTALFRRYFDIFPMADLRNATGFDLGCGSGRWALLVAPRVGTLHCIDPAAKALEVSKRTLGAYNNVQFHHAGVDDIPLADGSQDFGYSLGVLHHIPDTQAAMAACVRKLKPGAPFLVYLYYSFDNRPRWFRRLWKMTEVGRAFISRLPFPLRNTVSSTIAATVYYPAARTAGIAERLGADVANFPLSAYRGLSFYTMRTDALDRFGTRLEQRFSRSDIEAMMRKCGLEAIRFSDQEPYWVACGFRAK
jgi:ubiquinone/menaquinone biosynthesis C-methylase UbiE